MATARFRSRGASAGLHSWLKHSPFAARNARWSEQFASFADVSVCLLDGIRPEQPPFFSSHSSA